MKTEAKASHAAYCICSSVRVSAFQSPHLTSNILAGSTPRYSSVRAAKLFRLGKSSCSVTVRKSIRYQIRDSHNHC